MISENLDRKSDIQKSMGHDGVDNPVCSFKNHGIQGGIQGFTMGFTRISILVRNSGIQRDSGIHIRDSGIHRRDSGIHCWDSRVLAEFQFWARDSGIHYWDSEIHGFTVGIQGFGPLRNLKLTPRAYLH